MPVATVKFLSPDLCKAHPEKVFVFGDNSKRWGKRGQAAIRDEPNSHGVATKWYPAMQDYSFFKSGDTKARNLILSDFKPIKQFLAEGKTVVFPADGLGTGLAKLPETAPDLHSLIEDTINSFKAIHHTVSL